ncbi:MAG: type I restriction endonuclease subunit R [Cyclobacteriaceae bacterium]
MAVSYTEFPDSQLPALELLRKMGWQYLSPEEVDAHRHHLRSAVLLDEILLQQLHQINSFEYRGDTYKFSQTNLQSAVTALRNVSASEGIVPVSEKVYDLLTLGKSFEETIQRNAAQVDKKAFTLQYIDWKHPENNAYHATIEFTVEGTSGNRRPDIVLFVNGIPFVIIECKRRDKNLSIEEAIHQQIRNQTAEYGTPHLFYYSQLLLAVHPNEVRYAEVNTPKQFWAVWKEDNEAEVRQLIQSEANGIPAQDRLATSQDQALFALCRPERLMELAYQFIVYDDGAKKIARYQQYFAVKDTLQTVKQQEQDGSRPGLVRQGGVIWHTQGSGKSLTMVFLAKSLALDQDIVDPRVIVVTDRKSLDKQIHKTFRNCGKICERAKSGSHLIELLRDPGQETITALIDKFRTGLLQRRGFKDANPNIFVLVDESHRSQYGYTHTQMRKMLPNACYIGFTGTPLMKAEKNTARKFGGYIHKYTIDQAVEDGAVVPLLYEGRSAKITVLREQLDQAFERLGSGLTEEAQKDLKRKFSKLSKIFGTQQVIEEIAYDISQHFCKNWQNTPFKAQLAVPRIDTAIRYQRYFESQTDPELKINTRVIFTPPNKPEEAFDDDEDPRGLGRKYLDKILTRYKNYDEYEQNTVDRFKEPGNEVELLIVVTKLLTGFDAPRNTVLYLAKPLAEHNLLQAIARVNRLFEGKEHGYIIDYVGLLGNLDEALNRYTVLNDFEAEELGETVIDIRKEIRKLRERYSQLSAMFNGVNRKDNEAVERHLAPKDLRDEFYDRLSLFARTLQLALSSEMVYEEFSEGDIEHYKKELRYFQKLRTSIQNRYNEVVSYREYEPRVRKLLDTYIFTEGVEKSIETINIFDSQLRQDEMERLGMEQNRSLASIADEIASKMKKEATIRLDQDEAFYKKFSELIEETIQEFQEGRLEEQKYLARILELQNEFRTGKQEDLPAVLKGHPKAAVFYRNLQESLANSEDGEVSEEANQAIAQSGLDIMRIIESAIITDWKKNLDVQRKMENEIEDYLFSKRKAFGGKEITFDEIDLILQKCLKLAKNNYD